MSGFRRVIARCFRQALCRRLRSREKAFSPGRVGACCWIVHRWSALRRRGRGAGLGGRDRRYDAMTGVRSGQRCIWWSGCVSFGRTMGWCVCISAGEVTVRVPPWCAGRGGRNQHFALLCSERIAGDEITVLSAGSDGMDGNSPAAGAVVDGRTVAQGCDSPGIR